MYYNKFVKYANRTVIPITLGTSLPFANIPLETGLLDACNM